MAKVCSTTAEVKFKAEILKSRAMINNRIDRPMRLFKAFTVWLLQARL